VTPTAPIGFVDPWPDGLLLPGRTLPAGRIPIRPEPHSDPTSTWSPPEFTGREDRARVLVTLGTIADDPAALTAILDSLAPLDVNVIAAPHGRLGDRQADSAWLRLAGFVPMKQLLEGADVVVSAAGAGTVLSALSSARPMVLFPMGLDKPVNAERAAVAGAAVVIDAAGQAGDAVRQVLGDPKVAGAAAKVAAEIAAMPPPTRCSRSC
jgi:UDP:flavonoid glycosyltransferase YjiC (YdhE family)